MRRRRNREVEKEEEEEIAERKNFVNEPSKKYPLSTLLTKNFVAQI